MDEQEFPQLQNRIVRAFQGDNLTVEEIHFLDRIADRLVRDGARARLSAKDREQLDRLFGRLGIIRGGGG